MVSPEKLRYDIEVHENTQTTSNLSHARTHRIFIIFELPYELFREYVWWLWIYWSMKLDQVSSKSDEQFRSPSVWRIFEFPYNGSLWKGMRSRLHLLLTLNISMSFYTYLLGEPSQASYQLDRYIQTDRRFDTREEEYISHPLTWRNACAFVGTWAKPRWNTEVHNCTSNYDEIWPNYQLYRLLGFKKMWDRWGSRAGSVRDWRNTYNKKIRTLVWNEVMLAIRSSRNLARWSISIVANFLWGSAGYGI